MSDDQITGDPVNGAPINDDPINVQCPQAAVAIESGLVTASRRMHSPLISVVLPLLNEAAILERLVRLVTTSLSAAEISFEVVFVNDGSTDDSPQILDKLAEADPRIRVLHLSRNFGHQAAVQAGLEAASGDAVIVMDSDLQDDPASLPDFVSVWQQGYDVVYAVRTKRKENLLKRALFFSFYRVLNTLADSPIPMDAGNFSLLDRAVARQIVELQDCDRFFPGLRNWVGYRQKGIVVERLARHDDMPRVTLRQLFRLSKAAIFSFSRAPLTFFYLIAAGSWLVCLACIAFTSYHKFFTNLAIPGWTSITITASFFGALNALGIGVLGEYVARIFDQVRSRPHYIVARQSGLSDQFRDETNQDTLAAAVADQTETELLTAVRSLQQQVAALQSEQSGPIESLPAPIAVDHAR